MNYKKEESQIKSKILMLLLTLVMFFVFMLPTGSVHAQTVTSNSIGTHGGYDYEFWKDSGGSGSMNLNSGGTFSAEWSNVNNILFRKGRKFDETQTHQQLGNISINYSANFNPNGNSYLCVYGWTVDPLVEFYIVDSWGTWRPPGASSKGTVTIDGGTYDIYETTRTNQPSIRGTATFQQYWSVRRTKRTSGTISVSEHFKAWESLGMEMGNMYEVALTVEGYQSSGSANVTRNDLTIGGGSGGGSQPTPPPPSQPTPQPGDFNPNTQYRIVSLLGNRALDVANNSTDNGANIQQWSYGGGDNQRWYIRPEANNTFRIQSVRSGKVLDVAGNATTSGANVQQWDWNNSGNQRWTIDRQSDGSYRITNQNSGKVLHNTGSANGSNIEQRDWNASNNQLWIIEPVN